MIIRYMRRGIRSPLDGCFFDQPNRFTASAATLHPKPAPLGCVGASTTDAIAAFPFLPHAPPQVARQALVLSGKGLSQDCLQVLAPVLLLGLCLALKAADLAGFREETQAGRQDANPHRVTSQPQRPLFTRARARSHTVATDTPRGLRRGGLPAAASPRDVTNGVRKIGQ